MSDPELQRSVPKYSFRPDNRLWLTCVCLGFSVMLNLYQLSGSNSNNQTVLATPITCVIEDEQVTYLEEEVSGLQKQISNLQADFITSASDIQPLPIMISWQLANDIDICVKQMESLAWSPIWFGNTNYFVLHDRKPFTSFAERNVCSVDTGYNLLLCWNRFAWDLNFQSCMSGLREMRSPHYFHGHY
jgi:hypothetical protein